MGALPRRMHLTNIAPITRPRDTLSDDDETVGAARRHRPACGQMSCAFATLPAAAAHSCPMRARCELGQPLATPCAGVEVL